MGIPILKIRDKNGNIVPVPAIKGDKGDSYILTETDKQEIANMSITDQTYNPESENAQSGIAVAEVVGKLETALDGILSIQNAILGGDSI